MNARSLNRVGLCRAGAAVTALWILWLPFSARADAPSFRERVRAFVQSKAGNGDRPSLVGLPHGVEKVLALEYTVLLRKSDREEAVDAATYEFHIGNQIALRIQPLNEFFLYVFHEDHAGHLVCLRPADKSTPPAAKPDRPLKLPDEGGVFEFGSPPGDEKLILVASDVACEELAALADAVFKKPESELSPAEKQMRAELSARCEKTLRGIDERQSQGPTYRGRLDDEALVKISHDIESAPAALATLEEPPHDKLASTFSMAAAVRSSGPLRFRVTVPLKSVPATALDQ